MGVWSCCQNQYIEIPQREEDVQRLLITLLQEQRATEPPKLSYCRFLMLESKKNEKPSVDSGAGDVVWDSDVCLHFPPPHPLAEIVSSPRRPAETAALQAHLMCSTSTALGREGEADRKGKTEEKRERGRELVPAAVLRSLSRYCSLQHRNPKSLHRSCGEEPQI